MLSKREEEVLKLVEEGKSDKDVVKILSICHNTVRNHMKSIYRKLGVHNRTALLLSKRMTQASESVEQEAFKKALEKERELLSILVRGVTAPQVLQLSELMFHLGYQAAKNVE